MTDNIVDKFLSFARGDIQINENEDMVPLLQEIQNSPGAKEHIRGLAGQDAQNVVDLLQRMCDFLHERDQDDQPLRSSTRRLLIDLSKNSDCLSSSLERNLNISFQSLHAFAGGGYADVYNYTIDKKQVCIKKLRLYTQSDPAIREKMKRNLCREAMTARQFHHPNLLKIICTYRPDVAILCIITPKILPGNLLDYQRAPFRADPIEVDPLPLLIQVMDGLLYLHQENFVHGDIKAANVLVDIDAHVRLCDYGFTAFGDTTNGFQTNTEGGTHMRMAPELLHPTKYHLDNRKRTVQTDIYACGMLFLEAYILRDPFPLEDYTDVVYRVAVKRRRPLRPGIKDCHGRILPEGLWQLIERCWQEAASERPATQAVRGDLEGLRPFR